MAIPEMLRLQGMNPNELAIDVSDKDIGQQIGNATSVNVIERILSKVLQVLGHLD